MVLCVQVLLQRSTDKFIVFEWVVAVIIQVTTTRDPTAYLCKVVGCESRKQFTGGKDVKRMLRGLQRVLIGIREFKLWSEDMENEDSIH